MKILWELNNPLTANIGPAQTCQIPAGVIVEEVWDMEDGMVRVQWPDCTKTAMGMVNVSRIELEASADKISAEG